MKRIRRIGAFMFAAARRLLLPPCLFIAYVLGVGLAAALYRLGGDARSGARGNGSSWKPAGPASSLEDAESQS